MIKRAVLLLTLMTLMALCPLRAEQDFQGLSAQDIQSLSQSIDFLAAQLRDMLRAIDKDAPMVEHRWSVTGKGWFLDSFSRDNLAQTANKEMLRLLSKTKEGAGLAKSLTTLMWGQLSYDWGQESGSSRGKATALLRTRIQECLNGLGPMRQQLGEHGFGKDRKSYGCLPMNERIHCLRLMVRLQKDLQATKGQETNLVEPYKAMFTLASWRISNQLFAQRFYELKGYVSKVAQTGGRQEALALHPAQNSKLAGGKLCGGDQSAQAQAASALQTEVASKERQLATEMAALSQYLMNAEMFKKDEQYYKSPIALSLNPDSEFGDLFSGDLASSAPVEDGGLNMLGVENQQEMQSTLPYNENTDTAYANSTGSTSMEFTENEQWQSTDTAQYLDARDEFSQAGWQEQDIPGPGNSILQALLSAFRSGDFSHMAGSAISIPKNERSQEQPLD